MHSLQLCCCSSRQALTPRSVLLWQQVLPTLQIMQNQIASEVRDAVRAVNFFSERVAATSKAERVAARQLDAEQRRLREGVSTNFQVLQFQDDLLGQLVANLESGDVER